MAGFISLGRLRRGWGLLLQRGMKQFCLYLLCYLARTAQINYSHLSHSIHYSSCKHISQMKRLRAHLAFLSLALWTTRLGFPTCCKQSIKEAQCHLWDMVPAASSTDSCLPGSPNVWDLSVSISQLISLVHLTAACAAHSFCSSVSTCSLSHVGCKREAGEQGTALWWSTLQQQLLTVSRG